MNRDTGYFIMVNIVFFIIGFFAIFVNNRFRWQLGNDRRVSCRLRGVLSLLSLITFMGMTSQNIANVDLGSVINLTKVYEIRRLVTYRWGMHYLFSWQTKVINPFYCILSHTATGLRDICIVSIVAIYIDWP